MVSPGMGRAQKKTRWNPISPGEIRVGSPKRKALRVETSGKREGEFAPRRPKARELQDDDAVGGRRARRQLIEQPIFTGELSHYYRGPLKPGLQVYEAGQTLVQAFGYGVGRFTMRKARKDFKDIREKPTTNGKQVVGQDGVGCLARAAKVALDPDDF